MEAGALGSEYNAVGARARLRCPAVTITPIRRVILGIDPGLANCGYGVIASTRLGLEMLEYGCIETAAEMSMPERLAALDSALRRVIGTHHPEEAAYEQLYVGQNLSTALSVGRALGVIELVCGQLKVPVASYTPSEIKHAVSTAGRADKHQVQFMVGVLLGMSTPPTPHHAADALAVAITHSMRGRGRGHGTA